MERTYKKATASVVVRWGTTVLRLTGPGEGVQITVLAIDPWRIG
jgi:hypothetical protein